MMSYSHVSMNHYTLTLFNSQVYEVWAGALGHVGNLKRVGGVWKFKAIGYDESGAVCPGGGPLTDRHNAVLSAPTEALLNEALQAC